LFGRQK